MQEILTFANLVFPFINYVLSALNVLSALVVVVFLYARRRNVGLSRERITDRDMRESHFVIRYSKKALESNFLMILLGVTFSIFVFIFSDDIPMYEEIIFTFVVALVAFVSISGSLNTIRAALFRCTVHDDKFTRTVFLRGERTFRLQDIKKIEVLYLGNKKDPHRIILHSEWEKLLVINPFNIDHIGYEFLINLLKNSDIDGKENLPEGVMPVQEYLLNIKGFNFSGRVLFCIQCIVLLLGIAAFLTAADASEPFAQAYTATDVLVGYSEWSNLIFMVFIIVLTVMLIVNINIILFLKRKDRPSKLHSRTALISISVIVIIIGLFHLLENVPLGHNVQEDLAAIESGDLLEVTFPFHLSWENYYRTASLDDVGGYRPLYLVMHGQLGRIYFPKNLSPERLREIALDDIYQIPGTADGTRRLMLTITPSTQIVVDAVPIISYIV